MSPHFKLTLWSHCYDNLLSSTCLSQPLHCAVERGGGGGPSGGSGSAEEKEVGCCCSCVCACVVGLCVGVFMQRQIKAVSYTARR